MSAALSVLNVGTGDTKLSFDKSNPAEVIRASRIVKDMLRRGYALLIEVDDGAGGTKTVRAKDFDENTAEYIIADFDPVAAHAADEEELSNATDTEREAAQSRSDGAREDEGRSAGRRRGRPPKLRRVAAAGTAGVAVAPISGG